MNADDIEDALTFVEVRLRESARRGANAHPLAITGAPAAENGRPLAREALDTTHDSTPTEQMRTVVQALDEWLDDTIARRVAASTAPTDSEIQRLRRAVLARLFHLGELQPLLEDDDIETIHINGPDHVFVRDSDGRTRQIEGILGGDGEQLISLVKRLAAHDGLGERRWDVAAPFLNLTLRDGSRLHGIQAVTRQPCVTIRRHRLLHTDLDGLVGRGTLPPALARLLAACIQAGQSIVVAGGSGAGKSSTVRALASAIPPARRIVTIEDTLELHLDLDAERHPDCVAIETRPANTEGRGEITVTDALREALRMDTDVLIVGEVRINETVPMLLALAAGNVSGSLSTVHAFSSTGALQQLQTYAMVGPDRMPSESSARLIGSALNWVVHVERRREPGRERRRVVTSVREVCGSQGIQIRSNEVFRRDPDGQARLNAAVSDETRERLMHVGYDITELAEAGRFAG